MRKLYKTMLLLMVATIGMGTFVSCNDDDDLAKADALFRPIISTERLI